MYKININKLTPKQRETILLLPEDYREKLLHMDEEALAIAESHIAISNKDYPTKAFVPNIGQVRGLQCLAKPHPTYFKKYPHKVFVFGGNGTGKTASLAAILIPGICLGPDFINKEYFGDWQYFYDIEKLRKKRKLFVRLVADAADMKENAGSLYQQIQKWVPTAEFKDKVGDFFKTIKIGDVLIDFKSHAMPKTAHAGPDYDVVIFNEPVPDPEVYDENISRTRGRGRAFMFCTPLDVAAYLSKETEMTGPDGEVSVTYMSVWDNCKDILGTRGIWSRDEVDTMIRGWSRDPDSLDARVSGKPQHLSGVVFKTYNEDIHVIDPFQIDENYNVYHICDPHDTKPPYACWIAVDALNRCYVIAEYPDGDWSTLRSTSYTIKHHVGNFDTIERGMHPDFPYFRKVADFNLGDPNKMLCKLPNSTLTLKQEYDYSSGREYDCDVMDNIAIGFDKIRELLWCDAQKKIEFPTNCPQLFFFRTVKNMRRAMREFGYKKLRDQISARSDALDPTHECPLACLRYFAVKREAWATRGGKGIGGDYEAYLKGTHVKHDNLASCIYD
jgi:hypothetical protein